MKLSPEEIDDLIAKQLAGEAGPDDLARLETWKKEFAENLSFYHQSVELFRRIDALITPVDVNVNSAWDKVDQLITKEPEMKVIPLFPRKTIIRAAASILLLITLTIVLYTLAGDSKTAEMTLVAANCAEEKQLPDGSKVVLNKNASLEFVSHKNKREVKLKGEAFFDVVHNEKQPFVINVDGIFIEDIGTAFNVKALPGSNVVEVFVEEGEVRFYDADNAGVTLHKGESALYNKTTRQFAMLALPQVVNTISYKTKNFQYQATRLGDVITQLSDVYGINIELEKESLSNCQVSVMFNNERPEVIMEILAETLNLEVVQKDSVYIFKGESCQ